MSHSTYHILPDVGLNITNYIQNTKSTKSSSTFVWRIDFSLRFDQNWHQKKTKSLFIESSALHTDIKSNGDIR